MKKDTSWENSSAWYSKAVGEKGHYYHVNVILPKGIPLLDFKRFDSANLLDFGCGQGILGRALPREVDYTGVDLSPSLIKEAGRLNKEKNRTYLLGDATKQLPLNEGSFTHAASILAMQNMENLEGLIANAKRYLVPGGQLLLVMNHPCFRVPRKSSWGFDAKNKIQYRRIDAYMSDLKVPIEMQPSKQAASPITFSFHHSLTSYMSLLKKQGFMIEALEEWCSDKKSEGGRAKIEDKARDEIPLFLALLCNKNFKNE
jgi:SAM-dependent methyltransferase